MSSYRFNPATLQKLVCPVCHQALSLQQDEAQDTVQCTACGRRYPVLDGIPVLLASRATTQETRH